ncbi:MAG TPA: gfo/Idh/MocA family oxidoreductase, partial [Erysipelotrichaceae bacterium]|nr:gfo/Idh/MocA family oxidoreductase [Erysipelotrichaceae bacterium]
LYAIASQTPEKREAFQKAFPAEKVYDSYAALLNDEEVDVVYIALPHGMHYKWAKAALEANKCVLIEKPAVLHAQEFFELSQIASSRQLFLMEAMKSRFIPLNKVIHQEVTSGLIGQIVSIENHFQSHHDYDAHSYLYDEAQGGALYDCGTYCLASVLDLVPGQMTAIQNNVTYHHGVDVYDEVHLTFENGVKALCVCSIEDEVKDRSMIIKGTNGQIKVDYFYRPTEALIEAGEESYTVTVEIPYDDFYPEIEAVHQGISYLKTESPLMSHQDSIRLAQTLEAIKKVPHG